jgi:lipopolysaccharide/colanic/teichoic acid biosynthesis glycosyltransferase
MPGRENGRNHHSLARQNINTTQLMKNRLSLKGTRGRHDDPEDNIEQRTNPKAQQRNQKDDAQQRWVKVSGTLRKTKMDSALRLFCVPYKASF